MRYLSLLILFLSCASAFAQKVRITGVAPEYVGEVIEVQRIEDYLSDKRTVLTRATVQEDSTFQLSFFTDGIEKFVLSSDNNWGFLYAEPKAEYKVAFPERNPYDPNLPSGNQLELIFYDLDSSDINYKILGFQRWIDYFIGSTYHLRNDKSSMEFTAQLDTFKMNVNEYYNQDTSENSYFLKTYVRYSIAGLDNINTIAERNRFEKYDFYLSKYPVCYTNDVYMDYLTAFYKKTIPRLSNEVNEQIYEGVVRSSPTLMFNALGGEYTLKNPRIRELVMIQSLSEMYYSPEYPKTNIEMILDSLSKNSLFEDHEEIAQNILSRLTDLVPGSKAPAFVLSNGDDSKTLIDFQGKHLYMHFLDPNSKENLREIEILKGLNTVYGDYVQFVTIYKEKEDIPKSHQKQIDEIPWPTYALAPDHSIFKRYQIVNYPQYVFIDAAGYIVSSPAQGPTPDGEYDTIDRTFYYLKEAIDGQLKN